MFQVVGLDRARPDLPSPSQRLRAGLVRGKGSARAHRPSNRINQTGRNRPKPKLPCTHSRQLVKSIAAPANSKRTSTGTPAFAVAPGDSSSTPPCTVRPYSFASLSIPKASKYAFGFWPALRSPRATASSRPWSRVWIRFKPAPMA